MNMPTYKSGILQVKAYRILQENVSQTLEKFDINPSKWSILGLVYENKDGIRLSEIANILNVEPPLITQLVNELKQKRIMELHPHPQDKRAKLLFLTSKGKSLIPSVEQLLTETLNKLLANITKEELDAYRKVLESIIKNAKQLN